MAQVTARRVLLLGATGTIGRAVAAELAEAGIATVCLVRPGRGTGLPRGITVEEGSATDAGTLARCMKGRGFDAVISCLASRSGAPRDAWAIDHDANLRALEAAKAASIPHFILLSAICVQKPRLAFQHAKLAFEDKLAASGLRWTIVRPTAFFKSLSGQLARLRAGKPFLVFGDGRLTACTPISDGDLARFMVGCLDDPACHDVILPIGGPHPALTPLEQGAALFEALDMPPRFRPVPVALLDTIIAVLGTLGRLSPRLAEKAELARIGRYYATESMLVWDEVRGAYDAAATPATGTETLQDFYRELVAGRARIDRGDHAVF